MNTILTSEYYSTPDSGLVGYWRMDEGTGQSAADLSFYLNNATLGTSANPDESDPTWVEANILIVNVDSKNNKSSVPEHFTLSRNYPNPFNPETTIEYALPYNSFVQIKIFDVLGREIKTLVNDNLAAGKYKTIIDASELSSGVYFYRLSADNFTEIKKMILVK
jgi:hypothetical protein